MSEWKTLPLEDCMAAIIDYCGKSPDKTTFGVPLVTAKIVKGGRIEKPEEFIAEADFDEWMRRGMPKPGDIVMTTEAPLGEVAQLDGRKVALAQRVITLRGKPDVLDNTFLKFLLQSNPVQEELLSRGTGTTVVGIRQSELRKVSLTLPPLAEQKAIAAVLGALDDKIELNRRMNATLEAMARALFQSWFVDFDPARQNMDAKPAPCPIPEAANLPAGEAGGKWLTYAIECQGGSLYIGQTDNLRRRWKQHVDGKGAEWTKTHPPVALVFWETHDSLEAAVAREAKLKSGSGREWLKRKITERTSVRLPAGQAGAKLDLPAGQAGGRPPAALDPATAALFPDSFQESSLGPIPHGWEVCPLSEKIQLLSGGTPKTSEPTYWDGDNPWYSVRDAPSETDVWVIHTDKHVTKIGIANSAAQVFPEKTTIISARGTVGKLALTAVPMAMNQSCYGVRGITGYGDYFTYYSLREATAQLQQRTHGTVFDTITTETFKTLDCIFPTPKITAAFDKLVEPLLGQIHANLHQSRTLATLRDTLLPKLLSGELSVAATVAKSATVQTGKETRP